MLIKLRSGLIKLFFELCMLIKLRPGLIKLFFELCMLIKLRSGMIKLFFELCMLIKLFLELCKPIDLCLEMCNLLCQRCDHSPPATIRFSFDPRTVSAIKGRLPSGPGGSLSSHG